MWKLYAILAAIFATATAILAKIGIAGINTNLATAIRTVVILFITWGIVFFSGALKGIKTLTTHNIVFLVLSGLATGMSWLFYFKALQIGEVSKVAPIDKLSVVFTIIAAFLILGETPSMKTIVGGSLVAAGVLIIAL